MQTTFVAGTQYVWYCRDLCAVTALLLRRLGPRMEVPQLLPAGANQLSTLWHGQVFQDHLRTFYNGGANPAQDALIPLVFYSGEQQCQGGFGSLSMFLRMLILIHAPTNTSHASRRNSADPVQHNIGSVQHLSAAGEHRQPQPGDAVEAQRVRGCRCVPQVSEAASQGLR